MQDDLIKRTPYECRKYFEACVDNFAKIEGVTHQQYRQTLKWFLVRQGIIKKSTTELKPEQLEAMAEAMNKFHVQHTSRPPAERGIIDLLLIFKDIIK